MTKAPVLQSRLAILRRAIRGSAAAQGLAALAFTALAAIAATFTLDWFLRLTVAQRAVICGVAWVGLATVAWLRLARPLTRPLSDEEMALILEKYFPHLQDRVLTVVQLARRPLEANASEQLLAAVVEQANEAARQIRPRAALDTACFRRWCAVGSGAAAAVALAWALFPTTMNVWFQRNMLLRDTPWPQATHLRVVGFDSQPRRVIRGGTVEIAVEASGRRIPDWVRLDMVFAASGRFREEIPRTTGGRFLRTLEGVVEPFRFSVSGGDATTPSYSIELVEPPVLREVRFRAVFPPYTGLGAKTFGLGEGNLEVPVGTALELTAVCSKPLRGGRAFLGDREIGAVALADDRRISLRWRLAQSGRLRLALEDEEGFVSESAFVYPLFALSDRPPVVRLAVADVGERVTKVATVPIQVEARDDYGVIEMGLRYSKTDLAAGEGASIPLRDALLPSRLARLETIWPLEPLGLTEGDTLRFRLHARDAAEIPEEGNHAESSTLSLRIVSAEELLEELQRRQKAYRIEFERLVQRQREVVDATRLLCDRAAAGLSLPPSGEGSPAAILADERDIGNGSRNLADQFARVLTEMRHNRVSTKADDQRLEFRIVAPLSAVAQELLGQIALELERVEPSAAPETTLPLLQSVVTAQIRAHQRMQAILTEMIQVETLSDVVALLRTILENQQNLSAEVRKRLEEEIKRLLGGTP